MTQNEPLLVSVDDAASVPDHPAAAVDTLKLAMRRARSDDAERSGARAELRAARLGRLELLQDALQPLVEQIPSDIDMFDIALVPSSDPRLFVDMIGFIEMGRDARSYLLQQDTRHGRIRLAETESLETMVAAVTDYVARRLLERDKALASDARARTSPKWTGTASAAHLDSQFAAARGATRGAAEPSLGTPEDEAPKRTAPLRWAGIAFAFFIDLLGAITFFMILGAIGWYVWMRLHTPM